MSMSYQHEFFSDSFHGSGDVFIERWMTRLEHRRVVFLSADE